MSNNFKDGLYFGALGGIEKIGLNLYLYAIDNKWIIIDTGYGFAGDNLPGIDLIVPDVEFLKDKTDDILGIFISHAHEDHYGALGHILRELDCPNIPIYSTPFAKEMIIHRIKEFDILEYTNLKDLNPNGDRITVGDFDVEAFPITHSVPENMGFIIRTKYGNIVHATDYKFEDDPLIGNTLKYKSLEDVSKEGVLALISDSTNIFVDEEIGSEREVRTSLSKIIKNLDNKIAVACFSSNIERLETIAKVAFDYGRIPVLVGLSIERNYKLAKRCGYLKDLPEIKSNKDSKAPDNKKLYICTGSQGDPRAALNRIAGGTNPYIKLGKGDVVIFSSKIIPGNENKILGLQNKLAKLDVDIISSDYDFVHVSGHGGKQDIKKLYDIVKPQISIPVHGDAVQIREHINFAKNIGIKEALKVRNGDVIRFKDNQANIDSQIPVDILAVDRNKLVSLGSDLIRNRKKIAFNCSAFMTITMDNKNNLQKPIILSTLDVADLEEYPQIIPEVEKRIINAILETKNSSKKTDEQVKEIARVVTRQVIAKYTDIKPVMIVHLIRK